MASNGSLCKGIEHDKGIIHKFSFVEETMNVKWCFSKVPHYMFVSLQSYGLLIPPEVDFHEI